MDFGFLAFELGGVTFFDQGCAQFRIGAPQSDKHVEKHLT
jgi:hypothetical protein